MNAGAAFSTGDALFTRRHPGSPAHLPAGASPSFAAFTKYPHSQHQLYRLTVRPIDLSRLEVTVPGAAFPGYGLQRSGPLAAALFQSNWSLGCIVGTTFRPKSTVPSHPVAEHQYVIILSQSLEYALPGEGADRRGAGTPE